MHGWIRDIEAKIQEFRGPPKVNRLANKEPVVCSPISEGTCDKINTDEVPVSPFAGFVI